MYAITVKQCLRAGLPPHIHSAEHLADRVLELQKRGEMLITREILRAWDACYTDAEIAGLVPEAGLTPLQVLDLEIPAIDRLWVVLHEAVIPARDLRLLACRWARGALDAERAAGREPDPRSWAAVETAERYAVGEATVEQLAAASAAAWAAVWAAAWAAVWAAVWAARAAASDAACAAVRYAVSDAAWDAAGAATQLNDARAVIAALEAGKPLDPALLGGGLT